MVNASTFLELIQVNHGFEVCLGFYNNVDHFIGGSGNKIWYYITDGTSEDYYICTLNKNEQSDFHYTRKKKVLISKKAATGKTMELILSELSIGQAEIENCRRKPAIVEISGHPCSHYSFSFGEKAYRLSDEYGITVEYSNINDSISSFRLRNIKTGIDVRAPKEE